MPGPMADGTRRFLARHAETSIRTALQDTRIVAILGPRRSGKTTLAKRVADGRPFISLEDELDRRRAREDPALFVRSLDSAVIDEIQLAPDLVRALKSAVDRDPRPGRFLITGSVDLFGSPIAPDCLAGRVETVRLLPFSQAEIAGTGPPDFLDRAFAGDFPAFRETGSTPRLVERVVAGGFPEALARTDPARRRAWLRACANPRAERDVAAVAPVAKRDEMNALLGHAAASASGPANMSALGRALRIDGKTVDRWLSLLEHLFVIRRVPAWRHVALKRLARAPKLHFLDSGLLAARLRTGAEDLERERRKLGPPLESFVYGELAKAVALSGGEATVSHYRDREGTGVDFVLERTPGAVVGIEVRAHATLRSRDLSGLERLGETVGDGFACGIVLHDGERVQKVGDRIFAMPFKMLWEDPDRAARGDNAESGGTGNAMPALAVRPRRRPGCR